MYDTPFGLLSTDAPHGEPVSQERIEAELRGLGLLKTIVDQAETWTLRDVPGSTRQLLVACSEGDELRIDVIQTVERYLMHGDMHLQVSLYRGRNRSVGYTDSICILNHQGYECAVADGLISLVLLGEAHWPVYVTPHVLDRFANGARKERVTHRFKLGLIDLTPEDLDEINDVREALRIGMPMAALDMLCSFARRCYACKGMGIDEVQLHLRALFEEIEPQHIVKYARDPSNQSDLLFIPPNLGSV